MHFTHVNTNIKASDKAIDLFFNEQKEVKHKQPI